MHYRAGQTLYGAIGEYYQVVEDYRSSYSEQSTAQNIENDVTNGYLIALPTAEDIETISQDLAEAENTLSTKMDKQLTAVSGHIATFDNEGQVVDSGKTVDDIRPVWDDGE